MSRRLYISEGIGCLAIDSIHSIVVLVGMC